MAELSVTERGDLSLAMVLVRRNAAPAAAQAMRQHLGVDLPAPGRLTTDAGVTVLWHGPDRFLVLRDGARLKLAPALEVALEGAAYVANASSSRVVMTVAGTDAAEALNRVLPIDLHLRAFTPGSVALTRAAHIDVLVWRVAEEPSFGLACAASYGDSFRRVMRGAQASA